MWHKTETCTNWYRSKRQKGGSMARCFTIVCLSVSAAFAGVLGASEKDFEAPGLGDPGKLVRISIDKADDVTGDEFAKFAVIRGPDVRRQIVVTGHYSSGQVRDLTRDVTYSTEPEGLLDVDETGLVTPITDGKATVSIKGPSDTATAFEIEVKHTKNVLPINFPNQVVPIFTKLGCNGGGCHGKSGGQNGFSLSLLGFYPDEDYEYLVVEARGRRLFPAAPDHSLLLQKASAGVPHGGGQRMEEEELEYRLVRRWIEQGMPYGMPEDPTVTGIEVLPRHRIMDRHTKQQLTVFAHYSDGSVENVTPVAQFEPNLKEMASVTESGLVTAHDLTGDVAIMVRYQSQVATFRSTIPLGIEVKELPPERNLVDTFVFKQLKQLGLPPSSLCDDATFIRRATIDICGRLPTLEELESFQKNTDAEKRNKLVDRLLASGDYADYFANKWSAVLRNKRTNGQYTRGTYAFHEWIRDNLYHNRPYSEFVGDILSATGEIAQNPPVAWYRAVGKTEERVEDSAQLFLGLRIKCARCHHHPFEKWSQSDYYGFSAFFSQVGGKKSRLGQTNEDRVYHKWGAATAKNPRSGESLKPTGLGANPSDVAPEEDPRLALAAWMSAPENPFFGPAVVNRYWKHFFSRALVEPEDDIRDTNPASNPELLDGLSKHFVQNGFDLKDLVRTICTSSTYQLSAEPNKYNADDKQNFSRFYPKRLNAEVLYDSVNSMLGAQTAFGGLPAGTRAVQLPDTGVNNYFLTVFGRPMGNSSCECERSSDANLAQSLHLLNSKELQDKLSSAEGRAAKLTKEEKRSVDNRVVELYRRSYARDPVGDELEIAKAYIEKAENKQHAFEDIIWALINTKEFLFSH